MAQKLWTRPFIMIMGINFLIFLSFNMINPSLPLYFQDLGISETMTGVCISIFTVGSVIIRPIAGDVLDHFGRRGVFFISMILLAVLIFCYSFMATIALILILRVLHGIDWSFASTSTSTIATDIIPRHLTGTGIGIFGMSMSLALAVAPALAVELMDSVGFATMIHISSAFLVVALALGFFFPFDRTLQQETPVERQSKKRDKRDIFEKSAVLPAVIMGFITLTMSAVTTYVPLYGTTLGLGNTGYFFTIYAIGLLLVRAFIGHAIDRFGVIATTLPSLVFMLAAMLLLAFAQNLPMLLLSGFLYGSGFGGAQTTMQSLSVMNAPSERFGAANGTFFIGFDLGIGFGALLAGTLSDMLGFRMMYLLLIIFIVIATVLVLRFHPSKKSTI